MQLEGMVANGKVEVGGCEYGEKGAKGMRVDVNGGNRRCVWGTRVQVSRIPLY